MNISYDSYRVFYYAAKYKSFSQAAAALYNNQPNVTRIIRRLESQLHCYLFFRSPHGVRLTPEGEKLYVHIAAAFENIEAAEKEILSDQSIQNGVIHIASSGLALCSCLLHVLEQYRRAYPHVRICLANRSTPQGLYAVQNGLADFAVVSEQSNVPDSLSKQKVGQIQEIPICGSAFSHLAAAPIRFSRLAEYPIIGLMEGTSSHDFYSHLFLSRGLPFSPDIEVGTVDQVLPIVRSNLGIGFVPQEMISASPDLTGIYPIVLEDPIPPRSIYLFQRKGQPLSTAATQFRQILLDAFHE